MYRVCQFLLTLLIRHDICMTFYFSKRHVQRANRRISSPHKELRLHRFSISLWCSIYDRPLWREHFSCPTNRSFMPYTVPNSLRLGPVRIGRTIPSRMCQKSLSQACENCGHFRECLSAVFHWLPAAVGVGIAAVAAGVGNAVGGLGVDATGLAGATFVIYE